MPLSSDAWKFFKRAADKKSATCILCPTTLSLQGGTSKLSNHMRLKHPAEFRCEPSPVKLTSLDCYVNTPKKMTGSESESITIFFCMIWYVTIYTCREVCHCFDYHFLIKINKAWHWLHPITFVLTTIANFNDLPVAKYIYANWQLLLISKLLMHVILKG